MEEKLIKEFEDKNQEPQQKEKKKKFFLILVALLVVAGGVGTGYFLATKSPLKTESISREVTQEQVKPGVTVGVADEKSFKDSAEGTLEKGGVNGEGSHHLVRPGGDSQNVYLTSSVVDLEKFTGHKVKVWGQTFTAQTAGWLMDVGKLKVLE